MDKWQASNRSSVYSRPSDVGQARNHDQVLAIRLEAPTQFPHALGRNTRAARDNHCVCVSEPQRIFNVIQSTEQPDIRAGEIASRSPVRSARTDHKIASDEVL